MLCSQTKPRSWAEVQEGGRDPWEVADSGLRKGCTQLPKQAWVGGEEKGEEEEEEEGEDRHSGKEGKGREGNATTQSKTKGTRKDKQNGDRRRQRERALHGVQDISCLHWVGDIKAALTWELVSWPQVLGFLPGCFSPSRRSTPSSAEQTPRNLNGVPRISPVPCGGHPGGTRSFQGPPGQVEQLGALRSHQIPPWEGGSSSPFPAISKLGSMPVRGGPTEGG